MILQYYLHESKNIIDSSSHFCSAGIFSATPLAFAEGDESETNTEQKLAQKNVGSGASTNFNCGENNIDTVLPIQACGTIDLGAANSDLVKFLANAFLGTSYTQSTQELNSSKTVDS